MDAFSEQILSAMEYERQRSAPPEGFPVLPVIAADRYLDPDFLQLEWDSLWKKSWLYACHTDEIPEPGNFILWDKTATPILIIRGEDCEIRAFYNTCLHRGGPVVRDTQGKVNGRLVCSYHGWSYDLKGHLVGIRDKRDFVDFDLSCKSLMSVRCERIGNWVFINEDPEAQELIEHLGPIPDLMKQFQPDNIRHVHSQGYDVACNVKVLLDAFFEVYHLSSVHRDTVNRFLDHRGNVSVLWPHGHSVMITPNRRSEWVDPGTIDMLKIPTVTDIVKLHNISFNFYPNLVSPMSETGMPFLTFWPTSTNTMRIDVHWFSPDWGEGEKDPLWQTRIDNFERILFEDLQFAALIQQSLNSPAFKGMTLNYQERRIYHWHEELDRRIGAEQIPEHLRVKPMLQDYVEMTM